MKNNGFPERCGRPSGRGASEVDYRRMILDFRAELPDPDPYRDFTVQLFDVTLRVAWLEKNVTTPKEITPKEILKKRYNKIVISPGPGNPNQSGNCLKIVKSLYKKTR